MEPHLNHREVTPTVMDSVQSGTQQAHRLVLVSSGNVVESSPRVRVEPAVDAGNVFAGVRSPGTKVERGVSVLGHSGSSENFQATWSRHEVCASIREGAVQKRNEVGSRGGFSAR